MVLISNALIQTHTIYLERICYRMKVYITVNDETVLYTLSQKSPPSLLNRTTIYHADSLNYTINRYANAP